MVQPYLKQIDLLLIMTVNPVRLATLYAERCQRSNKADACGVTAVDYRLKSTVGSF